MITRKPGALKAMKVPLYVELGTCELTVEELAKLRAGSIVELNSIAGEPVMLKSGDELVAYAEVVVIDENFGVRVTSIAGEEDE